MYREGILPSGENMRGETRGRASLSGAMGACANCHRRSGMGSFEGGTAVRPVTGQALYRPSDFHGSAWADRAAPDRKKPWPAYTDESLARAIRQGIDPAGRSLDAAMPRYSLADADLRRLVDYLKSLSAGESPGVTEEVIRFATVVDARVGRDRRDAMLDVLRAFVRDKNAGTRREAARARAVPGPESRKNRAYRKWEIDEWEVTGPEETWGDQLEARYRRRPVFALIGGISAGGWGPVHRFCERFEVPCFFPDVAAPGIRGPGHYSVYFSRGVALEADALAWHLGGDPEVTRPLEVVQVYRDDGPGKAAAAAFRESLARTAVGSVLRDVLLPAAGEPPARFLETLPEGNRFSAAVLWLSGSDLRRLGEPAWNAASPRRIYLSSTLAGTTAASSLGAPTERVRLVHPFPLPGKEGPGLTRIRLWLRARNVPPGEERVQANAFFSVTIVAEALDRLLDFFSREYLIERVEHMAEDSVTPASYGRLSLGPGQRFASKGCYILRHVPGTGELIPVGDWIVPDTP